MRIELTINGIRETVEVEPRDSLADTLRERCGLTSVHLGCEHGSCGACTLSLDERAVRSCLVLSVACTERPIATLEGLASDPTMKMIKQNFHLRHALQCGFCTPGMLMAAYDLVRRRQHLDEAEVRHALAGQICRCTGYMGIVAAILDTHRSLASEAQGSASPVAMA